MTFTRELFINGFMSFIRRFRKTELFILSIVVDKNSKIKILSTVDDKNIKLSYFIDCSRYCQKGNAFEMSHGFEITDVISVL